MEVQHVLLLLEKLRLANYLAKSANGVVGQVVILLPEHKHEPEQLQDKGKIVLPLQKLRIVLYLVKSVAGVLGQHVIVI
jgi:hypothetical protein